MRLDQINIRDPFILPYGGRYYLYGSRVGKPDGPHSWGEQYGFDVYVSSDLENWTGPKCVFERNDEFWGQKDFWAPEVHAHNGRFYMLASFKAEGKCRGTHILAADAPDGWFRPVSPAPATPEDWECLDGTLYIDRQGEAHIVFCHEWLQVGNGTMCERKLSKDLSRAVSEPRVLWSARDFGAVASVSKGDITGYVTDGPFLLRCGDGTLVSIWSSYDENGYVELVARSDNGDIDGNWSVDQQPLSNKDGGHGMIFRTFAGETCFVMHKPNRSPLERPVIQRLTEENGVLRLEE